MAELLKQNKFVVMKLFTYFFHNTYFKKSLDTSFIQYIQTSEKQNIPS